MVLFAKDVLEHEFLSFSPETSALDAARSMKQNRQGFVIVVSNERPAGIVTEWDYLSKVVADSRDPAGMKLRELMTEGLVSVSPEEGLDGIARIMTEKGVRRVVVLKDGKILGVITARTILARLEEYVDKVSVTIARLQAPPP